jgi:hypothetical protein
MTLFEKITETGTKEGDSLQKKRTTILSNYLALVLCGAYIVLLLLPQNYNLDFFVELLIGILIFLLPILLNRFSFTNLSRLYLCWLPPIVIIVYLMIRLRGVEATVPSSFYVGIRFYLLAFSCIPYLLFDRNNVLLLIVGILPSLTSILFCDFFLGLAGVGFKQKGILDAGYAFTQIRVLVSYAVINGSLFFLNLIISRSDRAKERLLDELAEKSRLLQQQAENEVHQLNQQLRTNLEQLSEREFILNQSQRIAKIGSWEYRVENSFLFWSDEIYNIFGLDKNFDLNDQNHLKIMWGDQSEIVTAATVELLSTGKPFDLTLRAKTRLDIRNG